MRFCGTQDCKKREKVVYLLSYGRLPEMITDITKEN